MSEIKDKAKSVSKAPKTVPAGVSAGSVPGAPGGARRGRKEGELKKARRVKNAAAVVAAATAEAVEAAEIAAAAVETVAIASPVKLSDMVCDELRRLFEENNNRLDSAHQAMMVKMNARRWSPQKVARWWQDNVGIKVSRQQVEYYDPTKMAGNMLSAPLVQLFMDERRRFDLSVDDIALSSKAARVQVLNDVAEQAMADGAYVLVMSAIEQIAKEVNDAYAGKGGRGDLLDEDKIGDALSQMSRLTPEQQHQRITMIVQDAAQKASAAGALPSMPPFFAALFMPSGPGVPLPPASNQPGAVSAVSPAGALPGVPGAVVVDAEPLQPSLPAAVSGAVSGVAASVPAGPALPAGGLVRESRLTMESD